MSGLCRSLSSSSAKVLTEAALSPCPWFVSVRSKFSKARIPKELFAERSQEHEKYGGDPDQPHKLHIVTRVRSVIRRPYWEKEMVKHLGLQKVRLLSCSKPTTNKTFRHQFISGELIFFL
ncbi:hypothetical protein PAMP_003634 [Pampus punctatissimus]